MFFSLVIALWMTYGVVGPTAGRYYIPPYFIHEPSDTVVRRNEPVALNCVVGGSSASNNIVWKKDGRPIDTNEDVRRKIAPNGTLLFNKILDIKDAKPYVGEYQCFASSRAGRIASRKVRLDVADISSKFLYEPQNTTTWTGSVAQFSCQIRNALPSATIEWRKNGMLLSSNERVLIFDRGVLQIKQTKKSDEGEYSCTARNVVHARLSQSASLFVETGVNLEEKRLKFLGTPHNVTVVQGDEAVLDCAATGFPAPVVTWKKLTGNPRVFDDSFGISNLEFVNVTENDGGEFTCQASSGGITISKTVWLIVRDGDALLICEVTGSPPPSLFWLKNGNKVIPSETTKVTDYSGGTSLKLVNPDSKDGGIFQCFAENQLGNIQTIAAVIIHRSRPSWPPEIVNVTSLTPDSLDLAWQPPPKLSQNGVIVKYSIEWRQEGRRGWQVSTTEVPGHQNATALQVRLLPPRYGKELVKDYRLFYVQLKSSETEQGPLIIEKHHKEYILTGLRPGAEYLIKVMAWDGQRLGQPGAIYATTSQGPSSPPRNVNFKYESHDSIEVTWEKPTETNGQLISYEIYFTNNSSLPDSEWSLRRMRTGFIGHNNEKMYRRLWQLKLDTPFYFKIRAENEKGYGPFCKTIEVRPPIWMPRVNVSYTIISPKLVQLSWACPNNFNSAAVKRFTILITNNKNDPEGSWEKLSFVPSKKCSMVVTKTIAVSQYEVHFMKVRAEYGEKTPGKWSNLIEISTGNQSTAALRVQEPNDDPRFTIKLGIIIGCAIAAFCLVILGLFIIWRNPCR
ncbi:Neogenin [Acropora cervicornis]|uniref:Neogenin n=1 Tax=Acropora cervicornis TaxID=6130 RepID=A0AAD9R5N0_ACRCE|nr:Neogenin [Acropora cervicornis]